MCRQGGSRGELRCGMARVASRPLVAALEGLQALARDSDGRSGALVGWPSRRASRAPVQTRTRYGPSVPVVVSLVRLPCSRGPATSIGGQLACFGSRWQTARRRSECADEAAAEVCCAAVRRGPRAASRPQEAAVEGPQVPVRDLDGRLEARSNRSRRRANGALARL